MPLDWAPGNRREDRRVVETMTGDFPSETVCRVVGGDDTSTLASTLWTGTEHPLGANQVKGLVPTDPTPSE